MFPAEKSHVFVTKVAFWESRKYCSLSETIRGNPFYFSGVRLFTAVDVVILSLVELVSFFFNEKCLNK